MDLQPIVQWVAPIASTVLTSYAVSLINRNEKRREEDTRNREAWREGVNDRLQEQDGKIDAILEAQCTQMRSDITHKVHRYMDDLGAASTEEKQSLYAEYELYCNICTKYGIENHFVEQLIKQVMELPDRPK